MDEQSDKDSKKDLKSFPMEEVDKASTNSKKKKKPKHRFRAEGSSHHIVSNMILSQADSKYTENIIDYRYSDVIKVLMMIRDIFVKEPNLVYCKIPCVIVGDIHGQYADLLRMFKFFTKGDKPGYATQRYVFLGDYIDRGEQSLEVIMMVFLLKIKFKNSFHLLRGNHESRAINRVYGFQAELAERFLPEEAKNLFHMFNEAFTHMPLVCIVGDGIFCCHGGISPKIESLDDILKIPKPLADPTMNEIACDLVWADPMIDLKGCRPNTVRGVSVHFGEDALDEFLKKLKLRMVIRGHQMMMNGFNFFHQQKLVTIFTAASYYPDKANRGAVVFIDKHHRIGFKILAPKMTKDQEKGKEMLRKEHDEANDYDLGHILSVDDLKKVPPEEKAVDPNESVAETPPNMVQIPARKKIRPMKVDPNQSVVETASKPSKNEQNEE